MTYTGFPTHEDRSLPRWISASVAVGAVMFAMIGMLGVASGTAVSSERAAAGSSIDHAKAMSRSGTLMAQRVVSESSQSLLQPSPSCHLGSGGGNIVMVL